MEPETGWGEGRSPELLKADSHEPGASRLRRRSWSGASSLSSFGSRWLLLSFALVPLLVHGLVHALSSCGSALLLWFSNSCGSSSSCGSCARGPVSDLVVGDAEWRRGSAGCVARPSVSVRGASERARRPSRHLEGAGNLPRSHGPIRSAKAHGHKGPQTLSAPLSVRGSFVLLLSGCV